MLAVFAGVAVMHGQTGVLGLISYQRFGKRQTYNLKKKVQGGAIRFTLLGNVKNTNRTRLGRYD